MSRNVFKYSAMFALLLSAAVMGGCGSNGREGTSGGVAKVNEALCAQCHSASVETLTGDSIYGQYQVSVHALNSVGCQDCHGGGAMHNGVGPMPFPKPNHVQCKECHDNSGRTAEFPTINKYPLVTAYEGSKHLGVTIEEAQKCNRCHTHQGALLAAKFGYTGDKTVMDALGNAPGALAAGTGEPIKCNTCHVTHKPQDLRVDSEWNPSATVGVATTLPSLGGPYAGNAQYRLCTQCHTYINPNGTLVATASGGTTTAAFEHDTAWYSIIATTHYYSNPGNVAGAAINGYGMRFTLPDASVNPNPCFDCHGHESKTNTSTLTRTAAGTYVANTAVVPTIYTEWAKSGHAGGLLAAKYAAQEAYPKKSDGTYDRSVGMTNAVMAATVPGGVWNNHTTPGCNRCHNATGFVGILATPNGTAQPATATGQVLACWGCHTNPASGTLRTLSGTTFTNYTGRNGWNPIGYALNYSKQAYPDVKGSNLCIQCHDSREKDPGAIIAASTNYNRTHYKQSATTMYVKMGFLNLSTTTTAASTATYQNSLKSTQDGGTISSTHRILGTPAIIGRDGITAADTALVSNGPCVACHYAATNHTLTIDQKTITAACNKCHASEGGHAITTISAFDQYFLEPQSAAYQAALQLAIDLFNRRNTGITIAAEPPPLNGYVRAYKTSLLLPSGLVDPALSSNVSEAGAADWATAVTFTPYSDRTKLLGAVSNVVYLKRDAGAYAHARTYSRRLLYDTIDYLDDGILNLSVGATAIARSLLPLPVSPAIYSDSTHSTVSGLFTKGASAFTIVNGEPETLITGTSEAMTFLIKWSRSTGAWSTPERP